MAFDENSKLKEISANEQAKAVLSNHLPGIWDDSKIKMAMNFTLKKMASFGQSGISAEKLQEIVNDLAQIQ